MDGLRQGQAYLIRGPLSLAFRISDRRVTCVNWGRQGTGRAGSSVVIRMARVPPVFSVYHQVYIILDMLHIILGGTGN